MTDGENTIYIPSPHQTSSEFSTALPTRLRANILCVSHLVTVPCGRNLSSTSCSLRRRGWEGTRPAELGVDVRRRHVERGGYTFTSNPYFTQLRLWKSVYVSRSGGIEGWYTGAKLSAVTVIHVYCIPWRDPLTTGRCSLA